MSVVTEADLRAQLRAPTRGAHVVVPAGASLTPAASDFVKQWSLVLVSNNTSSSSPAPEQPWDRPAQFPVDFTGERPRCSTCGGTVTHKPSALTQLNADCFASKTHPRIVLRGRVDSLLAHVMLSQCQALAAGERTIAEHLGSLAAYCRELTSAEYHERPVAELALGEVSADEIHQATHDPQHKLGIAHLTIDGTAPELQHWLNVCRTQARELEIVAMEAFAACEQPYGASLCHAINRLSSAFYYLQLLLEAQTR